MYSKYTGVILKKHPLGEADELLTIYTKEAGKIRTKAVGSRRIKSRLAGYLQSLNEVEFETAGRANLSSAGGGGLPVLISARARTLNNYLREDLKKFAHALVGIETLYRLTPDRQANSAVYAQLIIFLKNLGQTRAEKAWVRRFQLTLLELSGFSMPYRQCLNCRRDLTEGAVFLAEKAGFFCPMCAQKEAPGMVLNGELMGELRALTGEVAGDVVSAEAALVIEGFLRYVLEREIKSKEFLEILNR